LQREDLRKVMELLGLKEHHARTLLIHYRWDVERIFELLDQKGRERLFSEAGISLRPASNAGLPSPAEVTCNVCYDDVPLSAASHMDCGHDYCNDCEYYSFGTK
jgi:ariadne-1